MFLYWKTIYIFIERRKETALFGFWGAITVITRNYFRSGKM